MTPELSFGLCATPSDSGKIVEPRLSAFPWYISLAARTEPYSKVGSPEKEYMRLLNINNTAYVIFGYLTARGSQSSVVSFMFLDGIIMVYRMNEKRCALV